MELLTDDRFGLIQADGKNLKTSTQRRRGSQRGLGVRFSPSLLCVEKAPLISNPDQ
jgi:hypothetical protein